MSLIYENDEYILFCQTQLLFKLNILLNKVCFIYYTSNKYKITLKILCVLVINIILSFYSIKITISLVFYQIISF